MTTNAGKYNLYYESSKPLYSEQEVREINKILNECDLRREDQTAPASGANKKSKVSVVTWSEVKEHLKKMETFIYDANKNHFHYDIIPIHDTHHVNINDYNKKESYDWHIDCNHYPSQYDLKLTCLVNMSTEKYKGGLLFLSGMRKIDSDNFNKEFGQPGAAVIFTSYRQHKVTPITKGTRRTISYWVQGPAWI